MHIDIFTPCILPTKCVTSTSWISIETLILHLIIRMAWGNKHGNVVNTNHCRVISHIHGVSWIMLWYFMRKKFSIYNGDELHPADYLRWLRFMICCWKSVWKIEIYVITLYDVSIISAIEFISVSLVITNIYLPRIHQNLNRNRLFC